MAVSELVAQNVVKEFRDKKKTFLALDQIDLTVGEHEFVSLLGPSGCGKSTLLRLVAGLDKVSEGKILLRDKEISKPGRDRGVVFQQYSLLPWMHAWENVAFALKKDRTKTKQKKKELAYHFLELVGLKGFEDVYPSQMSGGMQQRVAIARALVYKPNLLLMDEPFGALDAQTRKEMQDLVLKVFTEARSSVLFVTHDVDEAIYLSDRVYVMSAKPGRMAKEINIELPKPRDWNVQLSENFLKYKREILVELQNQKKLK
ncbi:ATP-binding cassette domain-containing protein [Terrilactibacillus sp. BCM23-1]|uniref:ATP-binding cassette domain-containing protein n=1 Tax=Terrilactibacillus tamarindi TaxID=2599694 RepID=A0A6N8CT31_9BACI|nr:ABC transporter ATP-binding protein [Terrilactibacillus tamarindi]MTT31156.1 ATP-binding cassette domain-containing protein [Terrilactibacillus tamarindi]